MRGLKQKSKSFQAQKTRQHNSGVKFLFELWIYGADEKNMHRANKNTRNKMNVCERGPIKGIKYIRENGFDGKIILREHFVLYLLIYCVLYDAYEREREREMGWVRSIRLFAFTWMWKKRSNFFLALATYGNANKKLDSQLRSIKCVIQSEILPKNCEPNETIAAATWNEKESKSESNISSISAFDRSFKSKPSYGLFAFLPTWCVQIIPLTQHGIAGEVHTHRPHIHTRAARAYEHFDDESMAADFTAEPLIKLAFC